MGAMNNLPGVNPQNWLDAPYNRWGFRHVGELTRTVPIARGQSPVVELPRDERCFDSFTFKHQGSDISFWPFLEATFTNALLVMHKGVVVFEHYVDGMQPSDTHLLMSASKSLTSTLCGVLYGQGMLKPGDLVVDHIPELRTTAWDGCTLQHLLDMRTGVRWNYDIDEYTILDVSDYRIHSRRDIPEDTAAWIRSIDRQMPHGGPFRYCSLATDVLGWVLQNASGKSFSELFSTNIWSAIGAEFDAEIMLDHSGFPLVEGGICTTLKDLGRFGQMCMNGGGVSDHQVVPGDWLGRLRMRDQGLVEIYAQAPEKESAHPDAFYHDCWWITDAEQGIYSASGMNGQQMLIHQPSQTVVVKFSAHPDALESDLFLLQDVGLKALCVSLM